MKIKAVIFDLDDTLYDQGQIRSLAAEQCVRAMIDRGLNCTVEEGARKIEELTEKNPKLNKFQEVVRYFGPYSEGLWKKGKEVYINADFRALNLYSEVRHILEKLRKDFKLVLVTEGSRKQQNKKIDVLGIREYFDYIFICEADKEEDFEEVLKILSLKNNEVLVVGDRIDKEISAGNKLGMKTLRILRGIYSRLSPGLKIEKPDFEINNLSGLFDIIDNINREEERAGSVNDINLNYKTKQLKIVAIGGGTGLPTIIEGLRKYTDNLTMIVTVTDSGRSSGILRKELEVLPPGDIRNCLIALSNSEKLMCDLFQYRFENGSLEGHNFGNLFIAALTKLTGSFEKAVEETSRILKLNGKVLPSTLDDVQICAELEDGNIIEEENKIKDWHNRYVHLRPKIKKVFLKPNAMANEKALEEIGDADLVVLCPGSLFTSIITNLLVNGVADAICRSNAKKVYVCNIMTQQSQTYGYKASDHVKRVIEYLHGPLDYVVLNSGKPNPELLESYRRENAFLVENDTDEIERLGIKVIVDELLDKSAEKKMLWEKKDLLRHDPDKIARVLMELI